MTDFLPLIITLLFLVIVFNFINRKFFHFSYEIALMLFATVLGAVFIGLSNYFLDTSVVKVLERLQPINIESFLMDGALCFMLFAGACHLKISDFLKQARSVGVYSFLATFLGAIIYGLIFYAFVRFFSIGMSFAERLKPEKSLSSRPCVLCGLSNEISSKKKHFFSGRFLSFDVS